MKETKESNIILFYYFFSSFSFNTHKTRSLCVFSSSYLPYLLENISQDLEDLPRCSLKLYYKYTYTHANTHTHIYIYIYIERERERKRSHLVHLMLEYVAILTFCTYCRLHCVNPTLHYITVVLFDVLSLCCVVLCCVVLCCVPTGVTLSILLFLFLLSFFPSFFSICFFHFFPCSASSNKSTLLNIICLIFLFIYFYLCIIYLFIYFVPLSVFRYSLPLFTILFSHPLLVTPSNFFNWKRIYIHKLLLL
ncbi:uncharacterized protein PWA37_000808 [Arxiozyma heterogenica]|uniref:uncharacterized protein n=1 Tax=Arxiozyma heterogenica TaxID=278026 RepID=UPI002F0A8ACC